MEIPAFENIKELKRTKKEIELKLNVKIKISGKKVILSGETYNEYEASMILDAINYGFSTKKALLLKEDDMILKKFNIKEFTRRKNIKDVKARIIGTKGKTRKTIEEISGCNIIINDNQIGIIGPVETIKDAATAIQNIIGGAKQSNAYSFLERTNRERKKLFIRDKIIR